MPLRRTKNYSVLLFDSKGKKIGKIDFDDDGIPTKRRYPFSRAVGFEVYYGNTYKTGFDLDNYSAQETKYFILGSVHTINTRRKRSQERRKQNKNLEQILGFNYRLYGKDRKVISPTNFRHAYYFAIFEGRKKVFVDDFEGLVTRDEKIEKMRRWRTQVDEDDKIIPSDCPPYEYEIERKDIDSPRVEPRPYHLRKRIGRFKRPVDVPPEEDSMGLVFDAVKSCMKSEFMKEWNEASGSARRFLFKIGVDFHDNVGNKLYKFADGEKDQPSLLKDQNKRSMYYSSAREILTAPGQFDLAMEDLKQDFLMDMKSYIKRAMAYGFKISEFEVENIVHYY